MQWHRPTITGHRHGQCVHMGGISLISCIVNPLLKSIFMFSSWDLFDIDFELSRISCWEITTTCAFQRASILTCLINEHILGKCSRSRSSITNPRTSPLSVKHKRPSTIPMHQYYNSKSQPNKTTVVPYYSMLVYPRQWPAWNTLNSSK